MKYVQRLSRNALRVNVTLAPRNDPSIPPAGRGQPANGPGVIEFPVSESGRGNSVESGAGATDS